MGIREKVLESFSTWDREKQLKEYQLFKQLGDFSPMTEMDYQLMETIINNPNVEAEIICTDGNCEIQHKERDQ